MGDVMSWWISIPLVLGAIWFLKIQPQSEIFRETQRNGVVDWSIRNGISGTDVFHYLVSNRIGWFLIGAAVGAMLPW